MKTLLIGGRGQLARDLRDFLPGDVLALDLPEFDITQPAQVADALQTHRPDWIINCAAQTNVDRCEDEPAEAFAINACGAQYVAQQAAKIGARLVYISTDYVFGADVDRELPYAECDPPAPLSVYGVSKCAGEQLTLAYDPTALVVRTCGLYGHAGARGKGGNFVETMLRVAGEGRPLRVVNDQRLSPTSTVECARGVVTLLQCGARGVVHVAAADACTWYEFAAEIFAYTGQPADLTPITTAEYPVKACRPAMSALCSERLAQLGVSPSPGWRAMLHAYLDGRGALGAGRPAADRTVRDAAPERDT